jgi:hypothetical protein
VVDGVIDSIDTDGIDTELFEVRDNFLANLTRAERVGLVGRTTRLEINTTDVEPLVALVECVSLDRDRSNSRCPSGSEDKGSQASE